MESVDNLSRDTTQGERMKIENIVIMVCPHGTILFLATNLPQAEVRITVDPTKSIIEYVKEWFPGVPYRFG